MIVFGCGGPSINIFMQSTNDSNEMNAIQIEIFQLRNSEQFKTASRESLIRNSNETLGKDLIINSKIEKIMVPGESYEIENINITDETKFIAIVGDFYSPSKDSWKQIIKVSDVNSVIKVIIGKNFISITEQ
jgi:type VI secretion system VasD/TssJ family lipoprotein